MRLENVKTNDESEYTKWFRACNCLIRERTQVNDMTNHIKYKHIRNEELLTKL
mgnify:CR=1 FL=1